MSTIMTASNSGRATTPLPIYSDIIKHRKFFISQLCSLMTILIHALLDTTSDSMTNTTASLAPIIS